ncbi:hypothetical protein HDU87_005304 [Geranomyces variabilis]|uniref:Uncharacterized protein n=1 Tax=Geranomyces variabilis TaxID=109894 RepID=A0AAD5THU2_9FUNG|nr:hypothetical protein HDU87_005304 [Geranomyces variabilis]
MSENDLFHDPIFGGPSASRTAARTYRHRRTASASATASAARAPSAAQPTPSSPAPAAAANAPNHPPAKRLRPANENANAKTSRRDGKGKGKGNREEIQPPSSPLVLGSRNRNSAVVVTGGTPKQHKFKAPPDHAQNFLAGIHLPLSPLTVFKDPCGAPPPSSPSDMSISPTRTMTPVVRASDRQQPREISAVQTTTPAPRAPAAAGVKAIITADDTPFIAKVFRTAKPAVTFSDKVFSPNQPEPEPEPEPEPLPTTNEANGQSDADDDSADKDPIAGYGDGEFARIASPREDAAPTTRRRARITLRYVDPLPQTDEQDELTQ